MARFVQIIEFQTARIEEVEALGWLSRTKKTRLPRFCCMVATADRYGPGDVSDHRRI